jgi:PAS domain S-box-containing protein
MDEYDQLTREELIALVRSLKDEDKCRPVNAHVSVPDLPVFSSKDLQQFEASRWPMRIIDCESLKFLAVNDAALRLYGYNLEEFLALTLLDTRHPADRINSVSALSAPLGYLNHMGQRRHVKKSGEVIAVDVIVQDILFNGRPARLALTIDVTDKIRMLEMLHQRDQAFKAMVEHAPDITVRFDRKLRYGYASSAISQLTGLEPRAFIGKTNQELGMPTDLTTLWDQSLKCVLQNGREQRIEFSYPASIGVRYFDARVVPEFGTDQKVHTMLVIARDITERRKYELSMQRNLALTKLFESLARAANEALTPEAAMLACLENICKQGDWALGRVEILENPRSGGTSPRSMWYGADMQFFHKFICVSNSNTHSGQGIFISRMLREQGPVWIEDLQQAVTFKRRRAAIEHGIKTGFAFPIIVGGTVVALMEVFSTHRKPPDPLMMDAAQTIASQLSRLVERELAHEANAQLAAIVASSLDAIVLRAVDGAILTWNAGAERLFGYSAEEIIGRSIDLLIPIDIREDSIRRRAQIMQGVALQDFEAVRIGKDGRRIEVAQCVTPIRDANGVIFAISNIMRDITERKRTERELQRQKKLLDTIIEHLPVGIAVKDVHTMRYVLRNRMADELTGVRNADAIGKRVDEMYSPEVAKIIQATDADALASGGAVITSPLALQATKGRTVRNLKVPVPDESKRYTHIVTILDDLTDIEQAQGALRRSEQRLSQLISMSPAVIFSFSLEQPHATTYISENVTGKIGWNPTDFTGSRSFWYEHIHPDDRARAEDVVSRIVADGRYRCDYRFRHKDGSWRWMREEGRTVCDESGGAYEAIGSWTDVTAERSEAEMRVQRALLQRDTLVREVHHRIKNNIQGVIGLLRRKIRTYPRSAPEIEEAILQLQTIALVYGLEGKGANRSLSLNEMLDSICALAENFTGESVIRTNQFSLQQPLSIVVEEAVAVAVALNELVFNALKHQSMDVDKKAVRIALFEGEGVAEIRISNRGRLPSQFNFKRGHGVNDGLDLVKSLLLQPGSDVIFNSGGGEVEVVLNLKPPLLTMHAATAS